MPNEPLKIYLRTYRKRAGLSQKDIAFLIDVKSRSTVAKHETDGSVPTLDSLICYELLFGILVRDLFDGHYRDVADLFRERVNALLYLLEEKSLNAERRRKIGALKRVLGEEDSDNTR